MAKNFLKYNMLRCLIFEISSILLPHVEGEGSTPSVKLFNN